MDYPSKTSIKVEHKSEPTKAAPPFKRERTEMNTLRLSSGLFAICSFKKPTFIAA